MHCFAPTSLLSSSHKFKAFKWIWSAGEDVPDWILCGSLSHISSYVKTYVRTGCGVSPEIEFWVSYPTELPKCIQKHAIIISVHLYPSSTLSQICFMLFLTLPSVITGLGTGTSKTLAFLFFLCLSFCVCPYICQIFLVFIYYFWETTALPLTDIADLQLRICKMQIHFFFPYFWEIILNNF